MNEWNNNKWNNEWLTEWTNEKKYWGTLHEWGKWNESMNELTWVNLNEWFEMNELKWNKQN